MYPYIASSTHENRASIGIQVPDRRLGLLGLLFRVAFVLLLAKVEVLLRPLGSSREDSEKAERKVGLQAAENRKPHLVRAPAHRSSHSQSFRHLQACNIAVHYCRQAREGRGVLKHLGCVLSSPAADVASNRENHHFVAEPSYSVDLVRCPDSSRNGANGRRMDSGLQFFLAQTVFGTRASRFAEVYVDFCTACQTS